VTGAKVGVVMGSDSDWAVMSDAVEALKMFGIDFEVEVLSAHRTPEKMINWGKTAAERGIGVVIAGAGGAAHLPGMLASVTSLPVIGVLDSLLSIVQMPAGIPVATVSIGGAKNAGILAARILGITDPEISKRLLEYANSLSELVEEKNTQLKDQISKGGK
jgi:5-(carboxyamino)imidazole ribonucleotide mutase